MKKILLCVFILLMSVNVFAGDVDTKPASNTVNNGNSEDISLEAEQVVYLWTKAAERGDADAQYVLGDIYYFGNGVEQNYEKAVYWFTLSAKQNNGYAQASLGFCYTNGYEVPKDFKLAYMWFLISLEYIPDDVNIKIVKEMLNELEINLTPAEIAEAQQMAVEWLERH